MLKSHRLGRQGSEGPPPAGSGSTVGHGGGQEPGQAARSACQNGGGASMPCPRAVPLVEGKVRLARARSRPDIQTGNQEVSWVG